MRAAGLFIHTILLTCLPAFAAGASVSGNVVDPSGAAIPGVVVTFRNADTRVGRTSTTRLDGTYVLTGVDAGTYGVEVRHPGFKPFNRPDVRVTEGAELQLGITLELNPQSETVTVTESAARVDTSSTQMGEATVGSKIEAIPVNGRSFTDLLALQSGVIPASSRQPNAVVMTGVSSISPSGSLNPGNLSISGQRENANGFSVNGSNVEEDVNMGAAIIPNLDAIAEFRVLTNNFDAQYGNYSGGQILVVTKSGGNGFHGDAFEFYRNTALDARGFFSPERAKFEQNQFGGVVGGPIKRDKVFFFADYQGSRTTQGVETGLISVPSVADRAGNLADVAGSLTGVVNGQSWASVLSQRLGYAVQSGEPYYTTGCAISTQCVFPNAQIPRSAFAAPSRNLLAYIPVPSHAGDLFSTSASNQTLHDNKGAMRVDGGSRLGMLSAYYFADDYAVDDPYPTGQGGASVPGFNALTLGRAQLASFSVTKAFGATTVNEFHFSFMRDSNNVGTPQGSVGTSLASQGFVTGPGTLGIVPLAPKIEGVENVAFNNFTIGTDTTGLLQHNNTFQWSDNFSKVAGAHTLKFGADIHYDQINTLPNVMYNGTFSFLGTETGSDFADFLLGIPSSYTQGDAQSFYNRNHYFGLFGQDSWRVKKNLTFNYGVRWDGISPWSEKYNQLQTLVPGQQSVVFPGAPAGLVFPGDAGVANTLAPARYRNFSPRVGLAYSPRDGKTTIRAGYGIFYTAFDALTAGVMSANPPFGYTYTSPAPPLFETPFVTAASGQSVGQRFPLPPAPRNASAQNPGTGVDWSIFEPITGTPAFFNGNTAPYSENYMFSIERQMTSNTLLSMSYVGTQAHHLLVLVEANPGNTALCLSLSQPSTVAAGTATCGPFGESGTYVSAAGLTINGTRGPLGSAFGSDSYQKTIGNSNYNAFEVNLRHDSGPLEFLLAYTYSKSIDQSSGLAEAVNPLNYSLSRALSAFDMTHNFVASYRYELPLDRMLRRSNRWTKGWSLSGITRLSSGLPVTLYNNTDSSLLGTQPNGVNNNGVDEPNYVPGALKLNTNPRNGGAAFNASLFNLPALGEMGTAARRFFHGPGIENVDAAISKTVVLTEAKSVQLRLEGFNVFNHAQFYGPAAVNGNITSASFGQVTSSAAPRLLQLAAKFCF